MYKHFIILFLIISSIAKSQINIQELPNEWIKTKMRMLDGSKDVSEPFLESKYHRWKFNGQKLCTSSNPITRINENCVEYKTEKNFIKTSDESGYEILKLTQDSLILIQRINNIVEKDKVRKYWFVKSSIIRNKLLDTFKKDSVIIAIESFSPVFNGNLSADISKEFRSKNRFPAFNLIGNIVFFPKKEKLEFEIANTRETQVIENQKNIDFIKETFGKAYKNWNLNDFKIFDKVYLPFIIKCNNEQFGNGLRVTGCSIYYHMNTVDDINKTYSISLQDLELSNENFLKGLKAIQNNKYDKAIQYFNKSYEIDHRKIDALYNIANIYSFQKDNINECKYLQKLKDLEQTEGINNYNLKCSAL
ncbi:hypothetical protein H5J24_01485 [Chryseobacterium capnotolerans]|uniref:tetratricopeptide repeat protein n=1 Tax=Chryseobacterium TaxID=59732 RepID=UPI00083A679F|nr:MULTISPECIES: hypothetical protein [Chryseobacterium]UHO38885.1 hypothetical protein H5J24_01485 [Chryseobacterium capnotolerans]